MDMQYVLLSPKGRIGPRTFLRGFILLTAGYMLMQIAEVLVSPAFFVLTLAFVYMYVCLFSKRLHDAGQSGWLYLVFLAGYILISLVLFGVLLPILSPFASEVLSQVVELVSAGNTPAAEAIVEGQERELNESLLLTSITSFLIASAILATIAARLASDPNPNRYGPPTDLGPNGLFN